MPPPDPAPPSEDAPPSLREKLRRLPERPGVYLMKDRLGQVLYVGKAKSLRRRVSSYFQPGRRPGHSPKVAALVDLVCDLETLETRSEPEALLLEGRLIKQYKPKYNTFFTDDKRFLLVRLDPAEPLPRFRLCRFRKDDSSRYFGPFVHGSLLRKALGQMRREFGILLGDARPQRLDAHTWRLYDDVRAELYGHANEVSSEAYAGRVEAAAQFLEGKSREWMEHLRAEMETAAREQRYEKAAELRDIVLALERTVEKTRKFERAVALPAPSAADEAGELQRALGLRAPVRSIECFDISHISGTFTVASMARVLDGRPDRAGYRRFRVRHPGGNDDFRSMEEIVGRRYRRLHDEGRAFPDLVVIDGGQGQVGAALKAFAALGLEPPPLIGLAKRAETVIFSDGRPPLNLPLHHAGLRLLQRARDEAHRFANTYNADLRSRRVRESILDDLEGLGPKRKAALLRHFGSLARLRAADPEAIAQAEGIGPRLAAEIAAFLAAHGDAPTAAPPSVADAHADASGAAAAPPPPPANPSAHA